MLSANAVQIPGVRWLLQLDFTYYTDTLDCLFSFFFFPLTKAHVQYGSGLKPCTIQFVNFDGAQYHLAAEVLYNTNLRATTTTTLSTRGVTIPIYLVSSAMDSIRQCVVLLKPVSISTSDPKSEFLCQSSLCCAVPTDPPEPPCMPGISPMPSNTMYHPYTHSPSALTEYLRHKLHSQQAKRLSCSLMVQAEQNIPLEHNNDAPGLSGLIN